MLKELSEVEFKKRFPKASAYGLEMHSPVYLENGVILIDTEWNGEVYTIKDQDGIESVYRPIQEPVSYDEEGEPGDWEIIGYEEI